ncbi:DUF4129 domain-containing protein [Hazenella coriacea]|uniref:Uncharacterized protein DUF4129 n=1 Tax=Hazenella coriacea TaxID=1179467 RepID=A0A4R3L514_9BACL|nr:DUF4129 domain-containing protein [Hazenella coriacea]TCS93870.1 uncharacterized protein DUF4129 [Hazenella coriacea]
MIPISADVEQAKKQLSEILSDPEFGRKNPNSDSLNLDRSPFKFPDWNLSLPEEMIWGVYIFIGVIVLLLFIWVVRIIWVQRLFNKSSSTRKSSASKGFELGFHDGWERSKQMAAEGNYRMAIRFLFQYILHFTGDKRKIILQIDKTNGEYRKEIQQTWAIQAGPFRSLTSQFDEVWYGQKQATEHDFQEYQQEVGSFIEKGEQNEAK